MIISGFMHKIHYKNRYLHVETEYFGGPDKKQVVTMIYEGGSVLDKISNLPESEDADACRRQMAGQHKQALRSILGGRYDVITEQKPSSPPLSPEEPAAEETPVPPIEELPPSVLSLGTSSSPSSEERPGEVEEEEDTRPVGDAVYRARYKLRELSVLPGFIGLNIFTSENRVMSLHGKEEWNLRENIRYFDEFLKKARELTAQGGMGEARMLHFRGDQFGFLAIFFVSEGDALLQPIAETFTHMVLFMRSESAWPEAEKLLHDLMKIIRSELARFSQHLAEGTAGV